MKNIEIAKVAFAKMVLAVHEMDYRADEDDVIIYCPDCVKINEKWYEFKELKEVNLS